MTTCCAGWIPPPGAPTVAEAIETIEHARWTHEWWAAQTEHEGHGDDCRVCATAGNPAHHRGVIARYDRVLMVLKGERGCDAGT